MTDAPVAMPPRPVAAQRSTIDPARRPKPSAELNAAYKVIQDYTAKDPSELTLREGDIVTVTATDAAEGLWAGKLRGRFGMFPPECVEPQETKAEFSFQPKNLRARGTRGVGGPPRGGAPPTRGGAAAAAGAPGTPPPPLGPRPPAPLPASLPGSDASPPAPATAPLPAQLPPASTNGPPSPAIGSAPTRGGITPPTRGGITPPTRGGITPPTRGGIAPPTRGGIAPPTRGGASPTAPTRGALARGTGRPVPPSAALKPDASDDTDETDDYATGDNDDHTDSFSAVESRDEPDDEDDEASDTDDTDSSTNDMSYDSPKSKVVYLSPLIDQSSVEQLPTTPSAPAIPDRSPPASPRGEFPTLPQRSPPPQRGAWSSMSFKRASVGPGARHSLGASRGFGSSTTIQRSDDSSSSSSSSSQPPPPEDDSLSNSGKKKTREDLRKDVLSEIIVTEADYVSDLETMINVFIFPLRAMHVVPDQVLYSIFSNAEVIIGCNQEFLRGLKEIFPDGQQSITAEAQIGDAFTKMADYFKMYKVYCANQQASLNTLEEQKKKNTQFKQYLEVAHSDTRCKGLFLADFLIKPIQRVCKYPLLLRELLRHTPEDHPDYKPLLQAMEKIQEVVSNINEGQRTFEGLQRIIELQNTIEGVPDLVAPGRRLHREGDLMYHKSAKSKGEMRHIFLLSDLIVLTTKKGSDKFEHKFSVNLDDCKLIVLADSPHIKNAFEITQKQLKCKCIISADTATELNNWVRDIKRLVKEFQKKKLLEIAQAKKKAEEDGPMIMGSPVPPSMLTTAVSSPQISRR